MKWLSWVAGLIFLGGAFAVWQRPPSGTSAIAESTEVAVAKQPDVLRYAAGSPELSSVSTKAAEFVPLPLAEPLNARITYNENVTARVSSPIAGRVTALRLQTGDSVQAGDALLQLDSPDLAAAAADVAKAVADERRKEAALERARMLLEGGVLARKDLENAEADYQQARAEGQRSHLRLLNLAPGGVSGSSFKLRAPLSGIIADRHANPGMEVRTDLPDPLFVITDTAQLWAIADLPERELGKVAVGRPAQLEIDAYPGRRFPATVQRIAETVDPATRRVQVRLSVANVDHKLKPEMYARITLIADESNKAVRVPNSALITQGLYSYVFVETALGVFRRRQVTLSVQDHAFSYISAGLATGEKVVERGALLLNAELLDAK